MNTEKKTSFRIILLVMVIVFALTLCACGEKQEESSEGEKKEETVEHVHDYTIEVGKSAGTCISKSYVEYACSAGDGATKRVEGGFGNHSYISHVCQYCGDIEKGDFVYEIGPNVKAYLYKELSDNYFLFIAGSGMTHNYTKSKKAPFATYAELIDNISIQNTVNGIGDYLFYGLSQFNLIDGGEGISSIGDYAFYGCADLNSITFSNKVTHVGKYAFGNCTDLLTCTIPSDKADIGECAFAGCRNISSLTLPIVSYTKVTPDVVFGALFGYSEEYIENAGQVLTINDKTYYYNIPKTNFSLVINGSGVIPERYFQGCTAFSSLVLSGDVTAIGNYAFSKCTELIELDVGDALEEIGEYAFELDASLSSFNAPETLRHIGKNAFYYCTSMTNFNYNGDLLDTIEMATFEGCTSLQKYVIGDNVQNIYMDAFKGCSKMNELVIGSGLVSCNNAFNYGADKLIIRSENICNLKDDKYNIYEQAQQVYVRRDIILASDCYILKNFVYNNENEEYIIYKK